MKSQQNKNPQRKTALAAVCAVALFEAGFPATLLAQELEQRE